MNGLRAHIFQQPGSQPAPQEENGQEQNQQPDEQNPVSGQARVPGVQAGQAERCHCQRKKYHKPLAGAESRLAVLKKTLHQKLFLANRCAAVIAKFSPAAQAGPAFRAHSLHWFAAVIAEFGFAAGGFTARWASDVGRGRLLSLNGRRL